MLGCSNLLCGEFKTKLHHVSALLDRASRNDLLEWVVYLLRSEFTGSPEMMFTLGTFRGWLKHLLAVNDTASPYQILELCRSR